MKRSTLILLLASLLLVGCQEPEELTPELAERVILGQVFQSQPIYAEVPRRVVWTRASPRDHYDELSLRTLEGLEKAGLVTVAKNGDDTEGEWIAEVTQEGFDRLGLVPSARGAALRGWIAEKTIDAVRNFVRHPDEPLVGRADIVYHYQNPTDLYDLFETKVDKPLDVPFMSVVSIHYDSGWQLKTLVEKERLEGSER